jgi:ketosteroid isomerase-like protein
MTARTSRALLAAVLGAVTQISGAAAPFAPLEAWKAAVANGDHAALARLYSSNAKVYTGHDKAPIALQDELTFWADMQARGLTGFNPRLLEITTARDKTRLRLRISATSGDMRQYAGILQEWAHQADGWKIVTLRRNPFEGEPLRTLPQPAAPNVKLYSEPREAEAELKAGLAKAAQEHKRVLVVFGGNWCYDCHVLDATFHSKDFAPLVDANYVVVHINVGEEGKDNNDLAARLGVALDKGVPSLGVIEPNGKVVYAQKNGEFEATEKIGPGDIRAFLEKWKPRITS